MRNTNARAAACASAAQRGERQRRRVARARAPTYPINFRVRSVCVCERERERAGRDVFMTAVSVRECAYVYIQAASILRLSRVRGSLWFRGGGFFGWRLIYGR